MKLHYRGRYNLDPESLPHGTHQPGAIPFKEAKDTKEMGIIANVLALVIMVPLLGLLYLRSGAVFLSLQFTLGVSASLLILLPHELLHAVCFKEDVYIYTNLKHGMLFVIGPEIMSKSRFIFLSMLPNLVFGFIPYAIAIINPSLIFLGAFGAMSISMGAGDYYNVFHAITQMPKGAKTYLYQFNSFWYLPS